MGEENKGGAGGGAPAGSTEEQLKQVLAKVAEMDAAMKAKDAKIESLNETYERTNALLQTFVNNDRRPGPAGGGNAGGGGRGNEIRLSRDYATDFSIPNEAVQAIVQDTLAVAGQHLDQRLTAEQQLRGARDKFYKDNPDLVGNEFLVASISQQVDIELPDKKMSEKFTETANRARAAIKRIQDARPSGEGGDVPPAVPGGGSGEGRGGGGGGENPEPPITPDAELSAEITERNKLRNRGFVRK